MERRFKISDHKVKDRDVDYSDSLSQFVQTVEGNRPEQRLIDMFRQKFGDMYDPRNAKTITQTLSAGQVIKPRFNRRGVELLTVVKGDAVVNGRQLKIGEIVRLDPGEILSARADDDSVIISHIHPFYSGLVHRTFVAPSISNSHNIGMSIVIIAKDVEHHICHCLISCMNQTYTNLQIILVDDGSSDDTLHKCRSMAAHDARVEIYSNPVGRNGIRRYGVSKASGDYIIIVDGDDWLNEDSVKILIDIAQESAGDCLIYGYDYYSDRTSQVWGATYPTGVKLKAPPLYYERNDRSAYEVSTHNHTIWMYAFARSLAQQVQNALIDVHLYEDMPFYLLMMGKTKRPTLCNYVLYHYRRDRIGQTTEKWSAVKPAHKLSCLNVSLAYSRTLIPPDDRFMQLILLYKVERVVDHELEVCRVADDTKGIKAWTEFWKTFVCSFDREIQEHIIEQPVEAKVRAVWLEMERQNATLAALATGR